MNDSSHAVSDKDHTSDVQYKTEHIAYNQDDDSVVIQLFGEFSTEERLNSITVNDIRYALKSYPGANIKVIIQSLGGSLNTAITAGSLIRMHEGRTEIVMIGMNASASTVFSQYFDYRTIAEDGQFLIHNVWGEATGDSETLKKAAGEFEKNNQIIVDLYAKRTGNQKTKIREWMSDGMWWDAKTAKKYGFVDEIVKYKKQGNFNNAKELELYNLINSVMESKNPKLFEDQSKASDQAVTKTDSKADEKNAVKSDNVAALQASVATERAKSQRLEAEKSSVMSTLESVEERNKALESEVKGLMEFKDKNIELDAQNKLHVETIKNLKEELTAERELNRELQNSIKSYAEINARNSMNVQTGKHTQIPTAMDSVKQTDPALSRAKMYQKTERTDNRL